jgi:hypothetical protein
VLTLIGGPIVRRFTKSLLCAALAGFLPCAAYGTVSLTLTDTVGTPNSVSLLAGQSFIVSLKLVSTSEQTTGLDYFLETLGTHGSGLFTVTARNLSGSFYPAIYTDDSTWNVPGLNVLDPRIGDSLMDFDMGGSVANVNSPTSAATMQVANYTILVAPNTPADTYVIQTATPVGRGWVGPAPDFFDHEILPNLQGSYTVIVTPEPTSLAFVGMGLMALRMRPRRK